jgi:tetratricopeptide (TPR) repeat protein
MTHYTETATSAIGTNPFTGLGEADKRVLSYAAAIGLEFDWSVLNIATEMEEEPLAESLERLVHHGILKELNWGDSYAFVRVATLAQAYGEISSSRLRVIHKKIAEAYEKLHTEPTPNMVFEMGRQFYLGRVHEKSLLYNRYAASLAMNAFSPDIAIHFLERALEDLSALPGDHRLEEAEVLKEIGEQHSALGDDARADECYGESLKKLPEDEVTLRALILLSRSDAVRVMDRTRLARQYCEEAIRLLEKVGHKKGLAMAHHSLGRTDYKEDKFEEGKREIEVTLSLLDPEKEGKEVAHCYIELGNVLSEMPKPSDQVMAIEYYHKAIKTLEPLHDYHELARAHNSLAVTIMALHPGEALRELREARECAEKCKDKRLQGWALFNTVEPHLSLGEGTEAARDNAKAREILSKIGDRLGLQQVTLNEAILAHYRKSYEESERAYLNAIRQSEELGYPGSVAEAHVHLAMMYEEWGKKELAAKAIAQVREAGEDFVSPELRASYEALKTRLASKERPPGT